MPKPAWKRALKRLADRSGVSVSQFISFRMAPLVERELRERDEAPVRRPAEGGGSKASGPLYQE